ncbi:uncharacterized protein LOC124959988 isoform X1 [Sciurus carolinensis]|uniref:uncharacterized protein LOC124959988 isoform X1 n=1 Tax=Sciurus carolinensis TaxID=30640 RepID=UPI001FB5502E|nr:uncharacterized protein LOC124959988 isoform X1 [Sciurus carolinensis]XP_047374455.1 uncharacterized protein LOC124959988 isoform X1 [Sciurus carolinensis]XP_047374456.1 uncharacterized protein LOC124959988 isoform X1 [Sciurus carolinensis]
MSEQKGIPLIISLRSARERLNQQLRRLSKALSHGSSGLAHIHGHSPLELGYKRAQVRREKVKMWVPWNGLIVIGKRVELLGRNTQKPRMWDPKADSEYWRPESVGKTVLKEKAGSQGRTGSAATALQDSAGLGPDSSRESWGKQDVKGKIGAESKPAGMTGESRKGSASEERSKSTGDRVGTSGEDLRSRENQLQQNKGHRLSGEELVYRGEKRGSGGENPVYRGEKRGSGGENPVYSREKRGSSGEKRRSSREKLKSSGEKLRTDGEDSRSISDKLGSSEEKLESTGEKLRSEENIERVIEIPGDERGLGFTDEEMEIPSESIKGTDKELEGIEEGVEAEGDNLREVKDITGEFISMEEKNVTGEGPSG